MTALTLQTVVLLLLAYFAGVLLATFARRAFQGSRPATAAAEQGGSMWLPKTAEPVPRSAAAAAPAARTVEPAAAGEARRFERALSGDGKPAPAAAEPAAADARFPKPTVAAATPPPAPSAASVAAASAIAAAAAGAAAGQKAAAAATAQQPPPRPAPAQPVLPAAAGSSGPAAVSAPLPQPAAPPATAATAPADDLTRIRAIDAALMQRLVATGVTRFQQIADWKPADVQRIGEALGLKGAIQQQNWIEQAQILAKGGQTAYNTAKPAAAVATAAPTAHQGERRALQPSGQSPTPAPAAARSDAGPPRVSERAAFAQASSPVATGGTQAAAAAAAALAAVRQSAATAAPKAAEPKPAAAATAAATATPASVGPAAPTAAIGVGRDNLQRIRGVNAEVEKLLNVQGVTRFVQVAGWSPADVQRFDRMLGYEGRIGRENWIEQARILARGGDPAPAPAPSPAPARQPAPAPARPAAAAAPAPAPATHAAAQAAVAAATAAAAALTRPAAVPPAQPPRAAQPAAPAPQPHPRPDQGRPAAPAAQVVSAAIAAATAATTPPPAAAVMKAAPAAAAAPAEPARPARLAEAIKDTATKVDTLAEAPQPARTDLSGLRSVRSEAYRGGDPGEAGRRIGAGDDLKRIRGIGVLIEKKLNAMGITSYGQIAGWSTADIDKVSAVLDFKGRIERENWVEQARILASGGQTEFSRRVDRGDVESSRNRP